MGFSPTIGEHIKAGLQRARKEGKTIGRATISDELAAKIRIAKREGMSNRKIGAMRDCKINCVK